MPIVAPGGGSSGTTALTITEGDGAPSISANALVVTNGTLTDSGGGTATLAITGGGGTQAFTGALAYATATQNISNGVFTPLVFDSEKYDTSAFHTAGSAQMTAPVSGYYIFGANVSWPGSASGSGQRFVGISYNGGTTNNDYLARQSIGGSAIGASNPRHISVTGQAYMTAAAYIEAHVYSSTGLSLDIGGTATGTASFWIALLGT